MHIEVHKLVPVAEVTELSGAHTPCACTSAIARAVSAVTPAVHLLQIQKCFQGYIPMHAIFAVLIYFFIPVVSRSYFTSRTPDKDQKINSSTFFTFKSYNPETFMSSTVDTFVPALRKRSQKVPHVKSGTSRFALYDSHDSTTIR